MDIAKSENRQKKQTIVHGQKKATRGAGHRRAMSGYGDTETGNEQRERGYESKIPDQGLMMRETGIQGNRTAVANREAKRSTANQDSCQAVMDLCLSWKRGELSSAKQGKPKKTIKTSQWLWERPPQGEH